MNVLFVQTTTQVCNAVITAVVWEAPGCTNDPGERPAGGLFLDQTEAEGLKKHFLNKRSIKIGYLRTFLILQKVAGKPPPNSSKQ